MYSIGSTALKGCVDRQDILQTTYKIFVIYLKTSLPVRLNSTQVQFLPDSHSISIQVDKQNYDVFVHTNNKYNITEKWRRKQAGK